MCGVVCVGVCGVDECVCVVLAVHASVWLCDVWVVVCGVCVFVSVSVFDWVYGLPCLCAYACLVGCMSVCTNACMCVCMHVWIDGCMDGCID